MKDEKKSVQDEKLKNEKKQAQEETEYDPYEGYTRENPPPWMDEFEYIDFMMTH